MKKRNFFLALAAMVAVSATAHAQSLKTNLSMEGNIGNLASWQQLSMFGSGPSDNRCAVVEFSFMYNFNDTLGLGVEYLNYGMNVTAYSEVITANFVALQMRVARPLQFTNDITVNLMFDAAFGCTFLTNEFSYDEVNYKTDRLGFGMDFSTGFTVPVFRIFSVGIKCGYYLSFLNKPKVDDAIPSNLLNFENQMITSTYVMGVLSVSLF